jgi:glycosyltransferase involved in cell wall biosynthesis
VLWVNSSIARYKLLTKSITFGAPWSRKKSRFTMAQQSSIAVIIPSYNSGEYLKETLQSVLQQTLPPDEVLVNDDGSTDGTAELAQSYGPPVRVFRRSGQRQAASRNFAASQTDCEWIAFLDHDDLWEPDKLEKQTNELRRNPQADLCYSARVTFEEKGGTFHRRKIFPVPPPDQIRKSLYRNTTFLPGSVVIRRATYLAAGGFSPALKYVEDWDLWLRLLHSGVQFAACFEPLLVTRYHGNNLSNNALAALEEQKDIFRRLVLPHLPASSRWWKQRSVQSGQEAVAAMILRENNDPRHLPLMARAIARFPFTFDRYKIIVHMILTRLGLWRLRTPEKITPESTPVKRGQN